jgi:nucleotide-binding universal stress UspA family protein
MPLGNPLRFATVDVAAGHLVETLISGNARLMDRNAAERYVLVHCLEVPFEGRLRLAGVDPQVIERYRTTNRLEAAQRMDDLASGAGLLANQWTLLTPSGLPPWMQIVRQEQEENCDLVVVGKHGQNVVEDLLLGSTTNMVLAEGSCDVLVSTRSDPVKSG